jgi:cytochrome c oxidase subunit IV
MNDNITSIEEIFNQHLEPIVPGLENNLSSSSSSSYFSDFFNFFFNLSWTTWLIVVLVLAFLGINVFVYLAKGTESATNFFAPLLAKIAALFGTTVKKTVNVSAQGTQKIVNVSAGTATAGLSEIQNITDGTPGNAAQQPDIMINNSLNRSLNTSTQQKQQENGEDYVADDSTSPIQQGKMGWCFIGEDRGFRSCEQVGVNDQCMSGDIFPTKDVCMNPNLRA